MQTGESSQLCVCVCACRGRESWSAHVTGGQEGRAREFGFFFLIMMINVEQVLTVCQVLGRAGRGPHGKGRHHSIVALML